MKSLTICFVLGLSATAVLGLCGCNPPGGAKSPANGAATHDHEHEPEHAHAHHGPHGGHIMEIGDEEYHAEWKHDDSGKVTFYILDKEVKAEVPIAAEEITIEVKIGNNEPVTYKLPAVNAQDGKASAFEIVDKQLLGVLETIKSEGVVATLHVTINGKAFAQRIKEHDHGH